MDDFFRMPSRHTDEGYLDINLALNALESAFIQLTGKGDAKGSFFPRMRERLRDRNHKVADYETCASDSDGTAHVTWFLHMYVMRDAET